ncbi:MAG: hypothetical protein WCC36_15630 [Gammaproteobacteria bacterium]
MPAVELIYDPDCPNVTAARRVLIEAFGLAGLAAHWQEWRRDDERAPEHVRRFGSPTVLVDGRDVAPEVDLDGHGCCRLYPDTADRLRAAPSPALIAARLRAGTTP